MITKFNARLIEDTDFANFIQGRKPDPIKEAYFKRDINRIREEYKKHMHKFTIYAHYDVMINSEAYTDLQNQLKEEREKRGKEKEFYEGQISDLTTQLEQTNKRVDDAEETLGIITKEKTYNSIYNSINDYVMTNLFYDNPEEELIVLLATDYAVSHKDEFDYSENYIKKIVGRADLQIEMDNRPIDDQLNSYFVTSNGTGMDLQIKIQDVLDKIWSSKTIMKKFFHSEDSIDPEDLIKIEDLIEKELSKYGEELSEEDINNIILNVAMQY